MYCTALLCTALHCTALHCTALQVPGRAGGLGGGGWLALQGPRPQPRAGRQQPLLQEQEERLGRRGLQGRQVEGDGET